MRRLSTLVSVVAVLLLSGAGAALADPPSRLAERVTDRAGVLAPGQAEQITSAVTALRVQGRIDLFVVYVASFDGADAQAWANRSAELSQLGSEDVLLAVAVQDRAYAVSAADGLPLPESTLHAVRTRDVEPRLAENDWAGAAIALADGLRTGGGGGVPVGLLVIGGVALVGGGAYAFTRWRRTRTPAPAGKAPTGGATNDEFKDVSTNDLAYRASAALIEVDDAVRTSEQELSAARMHFGDEAVAEFAAALAQSRADMLRAFELRQQLDDDQPEDETGKRSLHAEILRIASTADDRLDKQVESFDALRSLEARAPEYVIGLAHRLAAVRARVPQVDAAWMALLSRYSVGALEPVAGDLDQARNLLTAASIEVDEARTALVGAGPGSGPAAAVVSGRAAEDAITQAETLLDGVGRRESELTEATARVPAARAEVLQDLAEARAMGSLRPVAARAEAAVDAAAAATRGPLPDPVAALRLLDEAGAALDAGLADARAALDRANRAAAALDHTLLIARSAVSAASDFISTRRGAVGRGARTRLAEAQRHLQLASGPDPVAALHEAQQADTLAQEALRLAKADVSQWPSATGPSGNGLAADLGSLILGGILSGASEGYRSGRRRSSRGYGGSRRSPGSFGGSSSRGRRGGGGRF
ncbi:TPM domain-containing protein [Pseudonocardia aurantiaca]|uniref:TPM domain-containing protein n=1 Tax=Pseudonocardia aurantiaca TaxID=75290 RepID=A0ABW4FWX6_9PSEU